MEFKPKTKREAYDEIKKICRSMFLIGFILFLIGGTNLIVFHYTDKYIIHPVIFIYLIAAGMALELTAIYILIKYNKQLINKKEKITMSKTEAIIAMKEGKKITHEYFGSNEYLFMEYGIIYSEDGYNFDQTWDDRIGPEWEKGWNIYGTS